MSCGLFYRCIYCVCGPGNISVVLLSMQGQRALWFHQKYLNLCSEDERRSYGFGTTWGWVIKDRIVILGWTIPLSSSFFFVFFYLISITENNFSLLQFKLTTTLLIITFESVFLLLLFLFMIYLFLWKTQGFFSFFYIAIAAMYTMLQHVFLHSKTAWCSVADVKDTVFNLTLASEEHNKTWCNGQRHPSIHDVHGGNSKMNFPVKKKPMN